ncbi:glycine/D-amino acid oxidase-like deaminating enzyme [Actinocrispum wychmicini]|uniref:Glycine/D-amino acid oxidase-like deaminating enzyme n=1 Tax=Actinocrispum wychmicini TaxID=1213861 RepID=A0A4R2JRS0_9PSEU|nr:glycine/D-amino acid oxidase-like deaminating enzyme [Actinocrispum wychmicini]
MAAVRRIVVIGAGIVGTAVAERLGGRRDCAVTVVDRAARGRLPGSTGHAPGFVGVLAENPVLTELARMSVAVYRDLARRHPPAFHQVGALELASTTQTADRLARRAEAAADHDVPAALVTVGQAARMAPRLVAQARVEAALHLPWDGAADARVITAALRADAEATGVRFVPNANVLGFDVRGNRLTAVRTADDVLGADDVIIACGFWGPAVADLVGVSLPLVPIAHPYVYSRRRAAWGLATPLVRWPEHGVYARDHGDRDGLGTSDHDPPTPSCVDQAELPWPGGELDRAVARALALLPSEHRWDPVERLNGVQSITPDKAPLLGPLGGVDGLWAAEAVWVTHAAGAAHTLVALMFDQRAAVGPLDPGRFAGLSPAEWRRRALACYRPETRPPGDP